LHNTANKNSQTNAHENVISLVEVNILRHCVGGQVCLSTSLHSLQVLRRQ